MKRYSIVSWMRATLAAYWKRVLPILIASAFMSGVGILFPLVWQRLLDGAIQGIFDRRLLGVFITLIALQVIPVIFLMRERFVNQFGYDIRYKLYEQLLRLSIPFHKDRRSAKLILEANKGAGASTQLLRYLMDGEILADIPVAIFAMFFIARNSGFAVSILMVFFFCFFWLSMKAGRTISDLQSAYEELDNEVHARQEEVLAQIEAVKLHQAVRYEKNWFSEQAEKRLDLENRLDKAQSYFQMLIGFSHMIPFCIAMAIFLPRVAAGTMTVGLLFALQIFSTRAVSPAGYIGNIYEKLKRNAARIKPALKILAQQPTIVESATPTAMQPLRNAIRIENVTFTYPGTNEPILKDLNLEIPAGKKIAIVGRSGEGKSTLARLLVRFYDPDKGMISIDGIDLRQLSFNTLYQNVSYITQEVPIFSGTMAHNIQYGIDGASPEAITAACGHASAGFALTNRGLETEIGEKGSKLSGGERQRLALARIFLRKPSVIILDEATAALDSITEREIRNAFDRLLTMNGMTTMLVIAHRITTVQNADLIAVIDQGTINDSGTHEELLERNPLYQELCHEMAGT